MHQLAETREELLSEARAWILANPAPVQPWDVQGAGVPDLKFGDPNSYGLLAAAPAVLSKKSHGVYPAPEKIMVK